MDQLIDRYAHARESDQYFTCANVGCVRSGKSYMTKYLIKKIHRRYDVVMVFSNTANLNHAYHWLPAKKLFIVTDPDAGEPMLRQFMESQKKYVEVCLKAPRVLIIFDDFVAPYLYTNKHFCNLFLNHRHYRCSVIFNTQSIRYIPPSVKENLYWFTILSCRGLGEKKLRELLDDVPTANLQDCLQVISRDYHFIVIDYSSVVPEVIMSQPV